MRKSVVHRWAALLVSAVLIAGGLVSLPATPASASEYCEPGYVKVGDAIGEWISPWFATSNDIANRPRKIQYRARTATIGRYVYSNCQRSPNRYFPTANAYRWMLFGGGITAWGGYGGLSLNRGWRWPDYCAGYDPARRLWNTWSCL